jgi:hypothetical protein
VSSSASASISAGALALAARTAGAAGRLLLDAVREPLGAALPRTPEQLVRPAVLNGLLSGGAPIVSARLPGVDFESSNCRNFLIEIEAPGGDLPATLYAKLPGAAVTTRLFAGAVGFWELECHFCEQVAAQVPIRVPRVYSVTRSGSRFVLLLENLRADPSVKLFLNRDMAAGTTVERARRCLSMFAELHAGFDGWSAERREAILPLRLHPFLSASSRAITRALNTAAIAPCARAAPDLFGPEHAALCRRALARWDVLLAFWYQGPLTLVHGDSHLANTFEYGTPDGPRIGMLDFQAVHWSKGIRDVQYFLTHSLEPDLLAAHEDALIDHYLTELAKRGVALDPEQTREHYRAFSFQTLMVGVVSLGLGGLSEREDTVRTVLRRELAAIERLRFDEFLDHL